MIPTLRLSKTKWLTCGSLPDYNRVRCAGQELANSLYVTYSMNGQVLSETVTQIIASDWAPIIWWSSFVTQTILAEGFMLSRVATQTK